MGSGSRAGNPEASGFYFKGKGRVLTVFLAPLAAMWDKTGGNRRSKDPGGDGPEHGEAMAGGEEICYK